MQGLFLKFHPQFIIVWLPLRWKISENLNHLGNKADCVPNGIEWKSSEYERVDLSPWVSAQFLEGYNNGKSHRNANTPQVYSVVKVFSKNRFRRH